MKFTMPTAEELAKLTPAEIQELATQAAAELTVFQSRYAAKEEFTPEEVDRFEYLADSTESLGEAIAAADAVEQIPSRLEALTARTAPKPVAEVEPVVEPEPEPEPEPGADAASEAADVVAEAEAAAKDAVTPVTAAAPVSFAASTRSTTPPAPADDAAKGWALLPSAPNASSHVGKKVGFREIAMGIASVDPGSGQGIQQTGTSNGMAKQAIATITRPQVTMEATNEQVIYDWMDKLGLEIPGHGPATAEGLVAAGGWCAPSQQLYGFCGVNPAQGLISLPDFPFDMSRGGVRVPVSPDISALLTGLWRYTEAELEAVNGQGDPTAVKPIIELPCPDQFLEWRLEAIGWAAKAGILQRQAWPEAIENALQQIQVAHQHRVSQISIAKMVAGSGAARVVPTTAILGATSGVLNGLERNAISIRLLEGLGEEAVIEGTAPIWFRAVVRADLALREGKDVLSVSNTEIDGWLADRNIYLQYVNDWQPLDTESQEWPGSVDVMLYPAATWFRQLQNIITVGVQYPLQLLQLNQYTHIFTEDSFQVGKRCHTSRLIRIPLCVNGAVGARERIDCSGPYNTRVTKTVAFPGTPTGGGATLKFGPTGTPSAQILFNDTGANADTKLTAIDDGAVAAGDITVAGGPLPAAIQVTYPARLGDLQLGTNSLTGGTQPGAGVTIT